METKKDTPEQLIDALTQAKPQPSGSPKPTRRHRLSPPVRAAKTTAGVGLFVAWLLLFIMGMSLDSSRYSGFVMNKSLGVVHWTNLIIYGLLFTPTNGAILASLAGVLGGIASNLTADNRFRHLPPDFANPESSDFQSYLYMTESPLVSMLRGFLTYLIFVAGSYLTDFTSPANDANPAQFLGLTASAYFKFAVSVSLLAYLAGYDPSRMTNLINSFNMPRKDAGPTPKASFTANVHEKQTAININGQLNPKTTGDP